MRQETRKIILIRKRGKRCESCKLTHWLGKPVPLEMHHLVPPSEKEEDLQLVCPNCHALTQNYRGRGMRIPKNITDKDLVTATHRARTMRQLLILLNLVPKGGNYESIRGRLEKLDLYKKFDRSELINKFCLNCNIEISGRKKFCSVKCSNKYNLPGLGKTKIKWPHQKIVKNMVEDYGFSRTGRQLGVSDNAVRKFLKKVLWNR